MKNLLVAIHVGFLIKVTICVINDMTDKTGERDFSMWNLQELKGVGY